MSLTKPYEALGMPKPLVCRLPRGVAALNLLLLGLTLVSCLIYVVQVNRAMSTGYDLRAAENKMETLKTETMILQDKIATMSSVQALSARAAELGYEPVDKLEFVNPAEKSYAMK